MYHETGALQCIILHLFDDLSIAQLTKVLERGARALAERYKELLLKLNSMKVESNQIKQLL